MEKFSNSLVWNAEDMFNGNVKIEFPKRAKHKVDYDMIYQADGSHTFVVWAYNAKDYSVIEEVNLTDEGDFLETVREFLERYNGEFAVKI